MLSLDSPRWSELWHMHGNGSDVPDMIRRIATADDDDEYGEAMAEMWDAIYHQGDVCTAGYAITPHLAALCNDAPLWKRVNYILCIATIEKTRKEHLEQTSDVAIVPDALAADYFNTFASIPNMVTGCFDNDWDLEDCLRLLGCLAIAKGHPEVGEDILEMRDNVYPVCPNCDSPVPRPWQRSLSDGDRSP